MLGLGRGCDGGPRRSSLVVAATALIGTVTAMASIGLVLYVYFAKTHPDTCLNPQNSTNSGWRVHEECPKILTVINGSSSWGSYN